MGTDLEHSAAQPNPPGGWTNRAENLDAMSAVELTEALEHILDSTPEENYDETLIDVYLDALDQKTPMPELPDTGEAYADFRQGLQDLQMHIAPAVPKTAKRLSRSRRILRAALIAAIAILCVLGGMITAQAAGVDIFGTLARWTENVFSFGIITDSAADNSADMQKVAGQGMTHNQALRYASLQEALDAYGITEITAPTWYPEGYVLATLSVNSIPEANYFTLNSSYENNGHLLSICIKRYSDVPSIQTEKNDTIVESTEVEGITFYFIENSENYTVAWITEHYECYIVGPYGMGENVLREIVFSMFS